MSLKKIINILFILFSIGIIIYSIGFIIDYMLIIKYSIENGFSNTELIFSKVDRKNEIEILLRYSAVIIVYAICALFYCVLITFSREPRINREKK